MKKYISAIFCAPTGQWENHPNRLTDTVFQTLKDVGINRIFGFGMDMRHETIVKTLDFCEKYGISYLITLPCFWDYTRLTENSDGRPYSALSEKEKAELDTRFVNDISRYKNHKAFGGIFFEDETGYLTFPAVAHAKKVFDENFSGYEFHTNFYSYSINEQIFWGGIIPENKPFELDGDLKITFANRFNFFEKLVDGLMSLGKFEFISQDRYPFIDFADTVPTSVHKALFELNAFMKQKSIQYGSKFYNYMQVGQWNTVRPQSFAEMSLQMHVTAAYGADGFAFFPGVFPLDWMENCPESQYRAGKAAFLDCDGTPTIFADWVKKLNVFFTEIEEDILSSNFLGVSSYGVYRNGFDADDIKDVADSECIFTGELPNLFVFKDPSVEVNSQNEIMISVFEKDGVRRYYAVNLSTLYQNQAEIRLPRGKYVLHGDGTSRECDNNICLTFDAGQGVYLVKVK